MWSDRTAPETLRELVKGLHAVLPAPRKSATGERRVLKGSATLEQAAEALHREPGFAWLSGSKGPRLFHRPLVTVTYAEGEAEVRSCTGSARLKARAFDLLDAMLSAWGGAENALLVGFLGYDLAAELENLDPLPEKKFEFPGFYFGLYDSAVEWDGAGWVQSSTDAWRAVEDVVLPGADAAAVNLGAGAMASRPDRAAFEAAVARTVATIHAGDIFQTNLCRAVETQVAGGSEWELYRRLRSISPARYEAFLNLAPGSTVMSISPEQFLKLERGQVESSPIKGTRPRGATKQQDEALLAELLASGKDRAELAMIVDVVRNDLSRVCETGSVKVAEHAAFMTLPTVHHIFSRVTGRLRPSSTPVDLLRAAFPAASISGAPKIEAMRVAYAQEQQRRGPAMGAIGWISLTGDLEFSVAIRTAFTSGGRVRYYGGCGITADSNPREEFLESRHKIAAFARALGRESDPDW